MASFGIKLAAAFLLAQASIGLAAATGDNGLTDWLPMQDWRRCAQLARPGLIFEIRNAEGLSLFAECSDAPPAAPWDWKSPAVEFRPVQEPKPRHSSPLPAPAG